MATIQDARRALGRLRRGFGQAIDRIRRFAIENPLLVLLIAVALYLLVDFALMLVEGQMSPSRVARRLYRGLITGLLVGLAGIGLSMTYSILNFANIAHGDYITTGGFVGFGVAYLVGGFGDYTVGSLVLVGSGVEHVTGSTLDLAITAKPLAVLLGLVAATLGTIAVVSIVDRLVYRPMRDANPITLLIVSIGVAFALRYLIAFVYTAQGRGTVASTESWRLPLGIRADAHELTLLVAAVGLMLGVHVLLQRTKLGTAMRAMSDNEDLARITGIPTEWVVRWTWIIGGGLTGAAGYLIILERGTMSFQFGWLILLLVFAAVILGGIGSIYGAIWGGLVIGFTFELAPIWIPSDFQRAAAFAIMIVVLLYRPQGLFGGKTTA